MKKTCQNTPPEIWALAALPPPVTGMTLLTETVLQHVAQVRSVRVYNWSAGGSRKRVHNRFRRFLRSGYSIVRLLLHGRVNNARLYVTGNSQRGLSMNWLMIKAGRVLGYRIYLHHHAYTYIDNYDSTMARIAGLLSDRDAHIVHCPQMADEFRSRYPNATSRFEFLHPSVVSTSFAQPREEPHQPFRIGHLSNLTRAKGLDIVLEVFRTLREKGQDVRLRLAGPHNTREAERTVTWALKTYPGVIEHVGAVYGDAKVKYLSSIDCFLFPSRSESWGIVVDEAMAAGVPVICTDRGCMRTLLGKSAGLVVDNKCDFIAEAVRQIESWINSPAAYRLASQVGIEQATTLYQAGVHQLEELVSELCSPLTSC